MRRLVILVVLALLCGATVSVGIAWVRATMLHGDWMSDNEWIEFEARVRGSSNRQTLTVVRTTAGTEREIYAPMHYADGVSLPDVVESPGRSIVWHADEAWPDDADFCYENEYGWPRRCLMARRFERYPDPYLAYERVHGGVQVAPIDFGVSAMTRSSTWWRETMSQSGIRMLPFTPIWSGLVLNALLFSFPIVALSVLCVALRAVVTLWRRRRQRCVWCRYPLGSDDAICHECGKQKVDRRPLIGVWMLVVAGVLTGMLICAVTGYGAWRYTLLEPPPPAHLAAMHGDVDALRDLVASGQPIDERLMEAPYAGPDFTHGNQPLTLAVMRGHADVVRVLLDAGAAMAVRIDLLYRLAVSCRQADVVRVLGDAELGSVPDSSIWYLALVEGHVETVRALYEADPSLVTSENTLKRAARGGADVMRYVLGLREWSQSELVSGFRGGFRHAGDDAALAFIIDEIDFESLDASVDNGELVLLACRYRRLALVQKLIHSGASLPRSVPWVDSEIVETLNRLGVPLAPIQEGRETPLHEEAMRYDQPERIRELIEMGHPVNAQIADNWTPLHYAVVHGCVENVRVLLELGADPRIKTFEQTALRLAKDRRIVDADERLLKTQIANRAEIVRLIEDALERWGGAP